MLLTAEQHCRVASVYENAAADMRVPPWDEAWETETKERHMSPLVACFIKDESGTTAMSMP